MLDTDLFEEKFTELLRWYGKPAVALAIETYYEALQHIPDDALDPICKAIIGRHEFLPPVEKFLACYEGDPDAKAIAEWDSISQYAKTGRRVSEIGLSEIGVRALRSIGGLEVFQSDNFVATRSYIRRDFLETWRSIARSIDAENLRSRFPALSGAPNPTNDHSLTGERSGGETVKKLAPATTEPIAVPRYETYLDEKGNLCAYPIEN